jgi:hypothetical protein
LIRQTSSCLNNAFNCQKREILNLHLYILSTLFSYLNGKCQLLGRNYQNKGSRVEIDGFPSSCAKLWLTV